VTKPIVVDELLARIRVHLANARTTSGTQAALDASGRFLLSVDRTGKLLWCTPKARQLLAQLGSTSAEAVVLPSAVVEQLIRPRGDGLRAPSRIDVEANDRRIEFSFVSAVGPDELLLRLAELSTEPDELILRKTLALTSRESEVLLWVSRGKSNREIGKILDISPRTVNKHLEQIFQKLGVENRASAAARAVRALAR
jgi:DNA-binding CsgD family transcriptional regulator